MELVITLVRLWGIRWTEHVESVKYMRHEYTFFNERPEGKSPLGGPWRRWVDNIKM